MYFFYNDLLFKRVDGNTVNTEPPDRFGSCRKASLTSRHVKVVVGPVLRSSIRACEIRVFFLLK